MTLDGACAMIESTMPACHDPRWENIIGGIDEDGCVRPMSFELLEDLAAEWAALVPGRSSPEGAGALLRTARSLFTHSWFNYEFMAVACLVGFQALEAAFRELYPEVRQGKPLRALVQRAQNEKVFAPNISNLANTGVDLRNLMSHPGMPTAFTVGIAAPMLENTHRLVAAVLAAAAARGTSSYK